MTRSELLAIGRATGCAEEAGALAFLCDPQWTGAERAQLEKLKVESRQLNAETGWLCIRTGGTSGGMKFARHDEHTFAAAVRGFCAHFGLEQVNAVDVLPAYHVSGLMARVRCAATGGEHVAWGWKELEAGNAPAPKPRGGKDWVISLVPTQLQRLLANKDMVAWLRRFKIIFLGGGPVWPELADAAAKAELRVSLSYGMTETAAMVAALRPEEFSGGERTCGVALPHARVSVNAEGVICVTGESVFRGYVGGESSEARHKAPPNGPGNEREFVTEDLGRIDERGHLHVLGRRDAVIITGGKKVWPEEVEAVLRASGEFADVVLIGLPDAEWGEAVVACYVRGEHEPDFARAIAGLAAHRRPKRFVAIAAAEWPRNAQGKVSRRELTRAAEKICSNLNRRGDERR